jgi:hypothetical protein
VPFECSLMPAHDGLGLDDDEGIGPVAPALPKCNPEQAVEVGKTRSGTFPFEGGDLLAQCKVLSRPGESHPRPLSERCVNLSTHTAPIKQTVPPSLAANVQTDAAVSSRYSQ